MIEDDVKTWLASQGIVGPFSFDFFKLDNTVRTLIKLDAGQPSDDCKQWEYPLLTIQTRATTRAAARAQAYIVYRALNCSGPIAMGETKVAWAKATGRPFDLGRDDGGLSSFRTDFELHLHYNTTN